VTKNIPLTNNSNLEGKITRKKQRKGPPAAPPKTASSSAAVHISQLSSLNKERRVLLFWSIMFGTNSFLDNFLLDADADAVFQFRHGKSFLKRLNTWIGGQWTLGGEKKKISIVKWSLWWTGSPED